MLPVMEMSGVGPWDALADRVLLGEPVSREEALGILQSSDEQLFHLLAAAYRIRHRYFGNTVQLYFLVNAKSGLCPEDCGYCSQSKVAETPIPRYRILDRERLLDAARVAKERHAKTYCLVLSGRGPSEREMQAVEQIVPQIKSQFGLNVCACLGLLSGEQARRLKACGVDKVNHNLNTSERFYEEICSTHTFADRVATLKEVRRAGLQLCSGGIIGMGESDEDIVEMAINLRDLEVESIPLNFLNSIEGTPLQRTSHLNPRRCLKALCMFRFVNPSRELRIAGGREIHLRSLQPMGLLPANSVFVGDYLTTKGQPPEEDYRMLEDLGFRVTVATE